MSCRFQFFSIPKGKIPFLFRLIPRLYGVSFITIRKNKKEEETKKGEKAFLSLEKNLNREQKLSRSPS